MVPVIKWEEIMRKKRWIVGAALCLFFLSAACGGSIQGEDLEGSLPEVRESVVKQEELKGIPQNLNIYYGNAKADGLKVESKEVEAVLPETIIGYLAGYNIVSIDTKVNSFDTDEEEGKVILYLDLSKAFGEYIKTMGDSGEKVIMAALTNTFLEAYAADALVLTVEGEVLETVHSVYDRPLSYFKSEVFA